MSLKTEVEKKIINSLDASGGNGKLIWYDDKRANTEFKNFIEEIGSDFKQGKRVNDNRNFLIKVKKEEVGFNKDIMLKKFN